MGEVCESARVRARGGFPALRSLLLAATGLTGLTGLIAASAASAASPVLPTGATVTAGQAAIVQSGADALQISQTSARAIIDWSSFSIGQGASVAFDNGSGATLNRVTSGGPLSSIDGLMSATGSVYLINPNGVIIGKTGVVQVGGRFVASTLDLPDADFLAGGDLTFSGGSNAAVVNLGKVGSLGGDVVLIASQVRNEGAIDAPAGTVGLAAGYAVVLKDMADHDGLLTVAIGGAGTSATNAGAISAAAAALLANGGNIYALAGDTSGLIRATEVSGQGGRIFLTAPGGSATVEAGATLDASAAGSGDGGHVLVDSANTSFHGAALARGGAQGGDGGLVETSGTEVNFTDARIDTTAARGRGGLWLVDPINLTIDASNNATLSTNLATTDIALQTTVSGASGPGTQSSGAGDIIIAAPISWSSGHTLTLDAYHSLHIDAAITVAGAGGVVIKTNSAGTDGDYDFGLTSTGFDGSISFTGGAASGSSLKINGALYTLLYSLDDAQAQLAADLGGHYALAASLDATSAAWTPIGVDNTGSVLNSGNGFTGAFTGLGHTISNLTINAGAEYVGLFGYETGQVRDVGLVGGSVTGAVDVGGLVGYQAGGSITDAYTTGAVSGTAVGAFPAIHIGGLVGRQADGSIANAYATGAVSGNAAVGGLVGYQTGGSISDAYAAGTVSAYVNPAFLNGTGGIVGGLVGWQAAGSITSAYATGAVSGSVGNAGGLVGEQDGGSITDVHATGAVTGGGGLGGLVGDQGGGSITNAYASGAVTGTGDMVGGLVGQGGGAITGAYATGTVTGSNYVGGLVGHLFGGSISDTYATGAVTGSGDIVGGLVGALYTGAIANAYATGAVSGTDYVGGLVGWQFDPSSTIANAYATGAVSGTNYVGGLVGAQTSGSITDAYATGAVSGTDYVGGLVGGQDFGPSVVAIPPLPGAPLPIAGGSITDVYATGAVHGSGDYVGGLVGLPGLLGTLTRGYYDTETTGQTSDGALATGLTTAQLQGLAAISGSTFSLATNLGDSAGTVWGGGANGLYPYLKSFFPGGVQAVSGTAYTDAGATAAASGADGAVTVSLDAGGRLIGRATTGANGYYYMLVPAGTVANGSNLLVSTLADSASGVVNAATLAASTWSSASPAQTGVNLYGGFLSEPTNATSLSAAPDLASFKTAANAVASNATATGVIAALAAPGYLATGAFTIDRSYSGAGLLVRTPVGDALTVSSPVTITSGLGLLSGGALDIDAPITAEGAASVNLTYDGSSVTNLSFGLTSTGFLGSLSFTGGGGSGARLSLNGSSYILLYTPDDAQTQINDDLGGRYALATSLDATSTSWTPIGTDSASFTGAFTGLGHTISHLTISSAASNVGLFGYVDGQVRDIGLVGGSVTGQNAVGGLVGYQSSGSISDAYATGTVHGTYYVGGLVGYSADTIIRAYATGAVDGIEDVGGLAGLSDGSIADAYATGAVTGYGQVGGLVGYLSGGSIANAYASGAISGSGAEIGGLVGWLGSGSVTDAYAVGAVSGADYVGGLVGSQTFGSIRNAYATGAVSGGGGDYVGGLVGYLHLSSIVNGYWDTQTTGQASGGVNVTAAMATGLTTRQLQGLDPLPGSTDFFSLATNLDDTTWGGGANGLYPYLKSFFPGGVQAVSGVAYTGAGLVTAASGADGVVTVGLDAGSDLIGQATTGANGYYYVFVPAGTLAGGQGLVVYTTGAANAASFVESATGTSGVAASELDLHGGWLVQHGGASDLTLSGLNSLYASAIGGTAPSRFNLTNLEVHSAAASFTLDTPISLSGTLSLFSAGAVGQSESFSAAALRLAGGDFILTNPANRIGTVAGSTGALSLADSEGLTIRAVSGADGTSLSGLTSTGAVSVTATGSLTLASAVSADSGADVTLAATGAFINHVGAAGVTVSGGGRWLIYSDSPYDLDEVFGGLDSGATAVWATAAGASVTAGGDRYVFAWRPTLTVTTTSDAKTYGTDATGQIQSDYTITGYQAGVSGAYLGDTAAAAYAGAPSLNSDGASATASVAGGPYAITAGLGTLTSGIGYGFSFSDTGRLRVDPKPLTASLIGTVEKTYDGGADATLTGANFLLSGLVGSDSFAVGQTSGTYASKNAASGIDVSANLSADQFTAQGSTLASNYILPSAAAGAVGKIDPRAITVMAQPQSRYYGQSDPALTYTLTSGVLAAGDSLSGALSRTPGDLPGAYPILQGSLSALPNYAVTFVTAPLDILTPPRQDWVTSGSLFPTSTLVVPQQRSATENAGAALPADCKAAEGCPYPTNLRLSPAIHFGS